MDHSIFTGTALGIHAMAVHKEAVDRIALVIIAVSGAVVAWTALRVRRSPRPAESRRDVFRVDLAHRRPSESR